MKKHFSIIDYDGRLLSRLAINPVADGNELDVVFERDFALALSAPNAKLARDIHTVLCGAFPDNQFAIVRITRKRNKYLIDLPGADRPAWIFKAVESLGGTLIA